MTISQIIALVRDAAIVGALGWLLWLVHRSDQVSDLQAVQKQLTQNSKDIAAWQERADAAEQQRRIDMATVSAAIAQQHDPIIVRVPSSPGPVRNVPAGSGSGAAASGSADSGHGSGAERTIDVRPEVNAVELKYEAYLGTCRTLLSNCRVPK